MKDELSSVLITTKTPERYIEKLSADCKKCGHCCSYDSGIFLNDDIKRIAKHLNLPEKEVIDRFLQERTIFNKKIFKAKLVKQGKPYGHCVFLHENKSCTIHKVKPIHCRLSSGCGEYGQQTNIWYMLNYIIDKADPQAIRDWAEYLKTHPTIPGGELNDLVPDKALLIKILNYSKLK
jgi:Fe-S-cluster containining protein